MKSTVFKTITVIIGVLGAIGGIITANMFGTFNFALLIGSWISVALLCLIFYGISCVLEYLEELGAGKKTITPEITYAPIKSTEKVVEYVNNGDWVCPDCGRINKNYVGSCGCGYVKNISDFWKCSKCNVYSPKSQGDECMNCHWKK